ncbi:SH3 domain-containing protein [Botrytis cinerea]
MLVHERGRLQQEIMNQQSSGNDSDYTSVTTYLSKSNSANRRCDDSIAYEPLKLSPSQTMAKVSSKDGRGLNNGSKRKQRWTGSLTKATVISILASVPVAIADCISLSGSTQCSAFTSASIDTNLTGLFPFLSYVSDRATFDTQLSAYVQTSYVQSKYQQLLGCGNINLTNTSNLYARYTTTVICNSIIQNSKSSCSLSDTQAPPVCADSCAQFAESESIIIADSQLCSSPGSNAISQIRADFTNCALPSDSLTGSCVEGATNEPDNCGYGNSTFGLCQYCGTGGQNSTDTCCYNSGAESRCAGVVLPTITGFITFSTSTASSSSGTTTPPSSSTGAAAASSTSNKGLSSGAIAGIVIGSLLGLAALVGLIVFMCLRKRRGSQHGSILNQPTPARNNGMAYNPVHSNTTPEGYEVLPGGRIARIHGAIGGAVLGGAAGYAAGRRHDRESSSSDFGDSPRSGMQGGILRPPPNRRTGSLSSGSALGLDDPQTPGTGSMSSPRGVSSNQSEQLPFFKDYYSQDEIHPGDKVATLWAYQPRAGDEFSLERGDMLKVVGIWDDGWATGVMINERADEWDEKHKAQRDSGVSNTSGRRNDSPNVSGEIKAFPLVCVCLPDHWRRTIDGDGSTDSGGPPGL